MRSLVFLSISVLSSQVLANQNVFWADTKHQPQQLDLLTNQSNKQLTVQNDRVISMKLDRLSDHLRFVPQDSSSNQGAIISLPTKNGVVKYEIFESSIMEQELASKYPSIKTYSGRQVGQPEQVGRFSLTPHGFHGMYEVNNETLYIDPISGADHHKVYQYRSRAQKQQSALLKERIIRKSHQKSAASLQSKSADFSKTDGKLRTYRLAVAVTGEYTKFHGGTKEKGLAAVVTAINRVNQVYQNDLNVKLILVGNNDKLIYTDPTTDPYTNADGDIDTNTANIDKEIGNAAYDVGHIFQTSGGGVAGLGVVCSASEKGAGLTGMEQPTGDAFYIDYVSHELGHQFHSEHSFNGADSSCGGNRVDEYAYEPGSGSTVMSYAGICGADDIVSNSSPFFHTTSITQIYNFISSGDGASCAKIESASNEVPNVEAGQDYSIPAKTPFTLTGSASDDNQSALTYIWEQIDLGSATTGTLDDDGKRSLFRSFEPVSSPIRHFPQLSDTLNGKQTKGEFLPTTTRAMNFMLTVRDTQGALARDKMRVNVTKEAGPFKLTSPTSAVSWAPKSEQSISWDVAKTDMAPVNCSQVDILLSVDGGQTYPHKLQENTSNDGSSTVTIPELDTSKGRLKIQCSDNIFWAVNNADLTIGEGGSTGSFSITGQSELSMDEDSSIALQASQFTVANAPDGFPTGYNVRIESGQNYSVSSNTLTPSTNFNGTVSANIKLSNGNIVSETFTINISVKPVNDAPVATNDTASVDQDSSSALHNVLGNDSDPDGDQLTLSNHEYNGSGQVSISNNQISYTPASGFSGTESIKYTVKDPTSLTATATLTINVKQASSGEEPSSGGSKKGGGSLGFVTLLALLFARRFKTK